jgi:hypothetical protein
MANDSGFPTELLSFMRPITEKTYCARCELFRALDIYAPQVKSDLAKRVDEIRKNYRNVKDFSEISIYVTCSADDDLHSYKITGYGLFFRDDGDVDYLSLDHGVLCPILAEAVKLAGKYNLINQWFISIAAKSLHKWISSDEREWIIEPTPQQGFLGFAELGVEELTFSTTEWDPTKETRQEAEQRMKCDLERKLKGYFDSFEEWYQMEDYGKKQDMHYQWFVEYQVNEKSYNTIAKEDDYEYCTRQRVTSGVKDVAKLLGTPLRKARPGRPSKDKSS